MERVRRTRPRTVVALARVKDVVADADGDDRRPEVRCLSRSQLRDVETVDENLNGADVVKGATPAHVDVTGAEGRSRPMASGEVVGQVVGQRVEAAGG